MSNTDNKYVKDMTKGNTLILLLQFTLPLLAGNIFQQLYNLVDLIIVGKFVDQNAVGSVGATGSLNFLIVSLVIGLSIGIGIVTAQYFGSGDEEMVKKVIGNSVYIIAVAAVIMSMIGFFAAKPILQFMKTPDALIGDSILYLRTTSLGIMAVACFNLISSILRSLGDTKTPLKFLVVACVINIILDLLFVVVFNMSVVGVGIATAIAQVISAVLCLIYAYKTNSYFRLKRSHFKIDTIIMKKAIKVGVPVGIQNALIAFSCVALQFVVNKFGENYVTAFSMVNRIEQLVQQPFMSLGAALATYTGQNKGAGNLKRVKKGFVTATVMSTSFAILIGILFTLFGPFILSMFGDDPIILGYATTGLKTQCVFYAFLGLIYTTRNVLNGVGDAGFSVMTGFVEVIGRVGFAYPLSSIPQLGFMGIWLTTGITWFLNGTISLVRYKVGSWKKNFPVKDNNNKEENV